MHKQRQADGDCGGGGVGWSAAVLLLIVPFVAMQAGVAERLESPQCFAAA